MVEKLIIQDDSFRLYLIPIPHEDWINFRVRSVRQAGQKERRSRLAYSRNQRRFSETHSTKNFRDGNPEGLEKVQSLIEAAIKNGLV